MSLGILDWGIGGYGFVRLLSEAAPGVGYTYLSDAGFTPYGRVPADALRRRIEQAGRFFSVRGVTHLVIACNAASTVVPHARFPAELRVTDVLSHGVRATLGAPGTIGVVGGVRTIRSGAYTRPLRAAGRMARGRVAQPLSAHIERGNLAGALLDADLRRILGPLSGVDTLVLACTHYPAIAAAFERVLPGVTLVDPAVAMLAAIRDDLVSDGGSSVSFTTGDPEATAAAAAAAFGVVVRPIRVATSLETRDDPST